jgi:hypothetical protein
MGIVQNNIDSFPNGAMVGGTIGTMAAGSLGLRWNPPSGAHQRLVKLAWATAVVGGVAVALAAYFSGGGCHAHGRPLPCLPHAGPLAWALAINAATVVLLLVLQARTAAIR